MNPNINRRDLDTNICVPKIYILGTRGVPNRYGGFESLAENLQREFHERGLFCEVPSRGDTSPILPSTTMVSYKSSFLAPIYTLMQSKVDPRAHVIVVNVSNLISATLVRRRTSNVVLHGDGLDEERRKWGVFARALFRNFRRLAHLSSLTMIYDCDVLYQRYGVRNRGQTHMISYGGCPLAEQSADHSWTNPQSGFYLVIARPEPENQILEICEAFLDSKSNRDLVIVGAPSKETRYWNAVQKLSTKSVRIRLFGSEYDRQNRCNLYLSSCAVIHGHTVGGTNPSLVDAMSHGCPILAHDNVFNREVAREGASYWKTQDDLSEFLRNEHVHVPGYDPQDFIERYNWHDVVDKYLQVLGLTSSSSNF